MNIEKLQSTITNLFFASKKFWLCNIIGWITFWFLQAARASFDSSPIIGNMMKYSPTVAMGIFGSLLFRATHKSLKWHKLHPVQQIPMTALIACLFAVINIFINHFHLAANIPEICSREYLRPPFSCGILSDLFLQSFSVMLVWCLLYLLIQSERKGSHKASFNRKDIYKAATTLLAVNYLSTHLSVIAYVEWGNTYYLFSKQYVIDTLVGTIFGVIFSTYIIFVKSERELWGSRILILIPTIGIMSLCCTILSIGAGNVFLRIYNIETRTDLHFYNHLYFIFFGSSYGNFNSPSLFAGVLQGGITTNLFGVLFFSACRHSSEYRPSNKIIHLKSETRQLIAFWISNLFFWIFFGILIYASDLMDTVSFGASVPLTNAISFSCFGAFSGFILRHYIKHLSEKKSHL